MEAGSYLCAGDRLQTNNGGKIQVLCYATPGRARSAVLPLSSGEIAEQCRQDKAEQPVYARTPQNRTNCPKRKGPGEEENEPTLLVPYSNAILNTRPAFSWHPVANATSYIVQISGKGANWEKTVTSTTLSYPNEQLPFGYGSVYKVTIIARQGNSPIASSSSVLLVSPLHEKEGFGA